MNKSLAIIDKPKPIMTPAQDSLYRLIVGKLDSGAKLSLQEAREIWATKVARNVKDGVVYGNNYPCYYGETHWEGDRHLPMPEDLITFNVLNWLTKNIGLMVIRGHLKVIPMLELKDLQRFPDRDSKGRFLSAAPKSKSEGSKP